MSGEIYLCPVCCKRRGIAVEGAEIVIQRCDEHSEELTTAEIYAKGMTVGGYQKEKRLHAIRGGR